jgi:hypothetical protein
MSNPLNAMQILFINILMDGEPFSLLIRLALNFFSLSLSPSPSEPIAQLFNFFLLLSFPSS